MKCRTARHVGLLRAALSERELPEQGPDSPFTGDHQLRTQIRGAYAWGAGPCAMGAEYYVGRGGRRYACD